MTDFRLQWYRWYRPLLRLLPGYGSASGERSRRLARRRASAGAKGIVVTPRYPAAGGLGAAATAGFSAMTVEVDGNAVAHFWATFKKKPVFVPIESGSAHLSMHDAWRSSLTTISLQSQRVVRIAAIGPVADLGTSFVAIIDARTSS
jgi:hypothetical protein